MSLFALRGKQDDVCSGPISSDSTVTSNEPAYRKGYGKEAVVLMISLYVENVDKLGKLAR